MKMKIIIKLNIVICLVMACNINLFSQYLRVPETIQEQDQWCWAATSSCVLKYYGSNIQQCEAAEYTREVANWHNFGNINCCVDPLQGCNYWNYNYGNLGSIEDILHHWGVYNYGVEGVLGIPMCQVEINSGHPFIIRWGWTGGGGHFLVGHGVDVNNSMLYYMDPWFNEGLHIASYSWVVQNSDHTWTHTNRMITDPQFPSVPVLISPLNNTNNQPATLVFLWKKCDRVDSYKIQVSADSNFTSTFINDSTLTDTIKTVSSLLVSTKYYWHVQGKSSNGKSDYSDVWNFQTSATGIKPISNNVPGYFHLYQNYPNPFNPTTKIKFSIPVSQSPLYERGVGGFVVLIIYDLLGREVARLVDENLQPGTYEVEWSATGGAFNYPSGVYFYKLSATGGAGDFNETKKMVILK